MSPRLPHGTQAFVFNVYQNYGIKHDVSFIESQEKQQEFTTKLWQAKFASQPQTFLLDVHFSPCSSRGSTPIEGQYQALAQVESGPDGDRFKILSYSQDSVPDHQKNVQLDKHPHLRYDLCMLEHAWNGTFSGVSKLTDLIARQLLSQLNPAKERLTLIAALEPDLPDDLVDLFKSTCARLESEESFSDDDLDRFDE
jgi:hypothetical protein